MLVSTGENQGALEAAAPLRLAVAGILAARPRYGEALAAESTMQVVALAESDLRVARSWSRTLTGKPVVFPDITSLLRETEDLDAVLIVASMPERGRQILAALRAGKSVLCDFPFTLNMADTDRLLKLAEEQGVVLMPALPRRFDHHFREMVAQTFSGEIGELRQLRCDWSIPVNNPSDNDSEGADGETDWHTLLLHVGCQAVDAGRLWLGNALTVSADLEFQTGKALKRATGGRNGEALATLLVTHERGNAVYHLSRIRSTQTGERYTVQGSLGHIDLIAGAGVTLPTSSVPSLTLYRPGQRPERIEVASDSRLPIAAARRQRLLRYFTLSVRSRDTLSLGQQARAAMEIVHAAYVSAAESSKILLPMRRLPDLSVLLHDPNSPDAIVARPLF